MPTAIAVLIVNGIVIEVVLLHVLTDQHDEWLKASPADEEDNWANVTDLEAGNHYTFAVVAANLINQTKSDKITVLVGERSGRTNNCIVLYFVHLCSASLSVSLSELSFIMTVHRTLSNPMSSSPVSITSN